MEWNVCGGEGMLLAERTSVAEQRGGGVNGSCRDLQGAQQQKDKCHENNVNKWINIQLRSRTDLIVSAIVLHSVD